MRTGSDRSENDLEEYDYVPEYVPSRGRRDAADSSAYWRRRFFILAGGLVALGLCAWLIPGGHHPASTTATERQSAVAMATRDTLPSAAYGPAYGSHTRRPAPTASVKPSPSGSVTSTVSATPTVPVTHTHAAKKPKVAVSGHPSGSASPSAPGGAQCAPHDIVLSLFTTAPSYAPHAMPTFQVFAVSTAATPCTMTYGPGAVQVVVTRQGHVVWNSAACKPKPGSPVRLTLGVPHELTVTWNRQATSPPGCAGTLPAGASGTFDVVAMVAGQSSPVRTFALAKS